MHLFIFTNKLPTLQHLARPQYAFTEVGRDDLGYVCLCSFFLFMNTNLVFLFLRTKKEQKCVCLRFCSKFIFLFPETNLEQKQEKLVYCFWNTLDKQIFSPFFLFFFFSSSFFFGWSPERRPDPARLASSASPWLGEAAGPHRLVAGHGRGRWLAKRKKKERKIRKI